MPPVPTVKVKILFLRDAVQHHHWCFPFAVDGNPEPNITWLYNGKELKQSPYTYTNFLTDVNDGSVKHGCLSLNKPTHLNNGLYTMIVENKLGRDEATATGTFMENPFGSHNPEWIIPGEILTLLGSFLVNREDCGGRSFFFVMNCRSSEKCESQYEALNQG